MTHQNMYFSSIFYFFIDILTNQQWILVLFYVYLRQLK